jgi:GlpG protein
MPPPWRRPKNTIDEVHILIQAQRVKNLITKYPVVFTLAAVCFLFAIATSIHEGMYDLFAWHSKPDYFWQYFSGTFMHGIPGASLWVLWVHLFLNYIMLILSGSVVESVMGSKYTGIVFIVAMVISSVTFQIVHYNQEEMACGISAVGYAFVTGNILIAIKSWKTYLPKNRIVFIVLCSIAAINLSPTSMGRLSTFLHLSGILSYVIVYFSMKLWNRTKPQKALMNDE